MWLGLFVVCFFNLRFGWVLSGLIVPGFLVPLMMAKPFGAWVIFIEAIVTYAIVRGWANACRMLNVYEVFGRDRFFALVLVSVIVRLGFEKLLIPFAEKLIASYSATPMDLSTPLQSFGLIIIALIANTFWKPGLVRGASSTLVIIVITWCLVDALSSWTNFNISHLSYMYDDLSGSIDASPKAYIILLMAAYIASRMNARFGWEYNGILIPSLLALQWYHPESLVITLVETLIIYALAKIVLSVPQVAKWDITGARQILVFFNIAFFYKLSLAYFFQFFYPENSVTDYFAYGYLLSTLLAIKMHEKAVVTRIIRSVLETSLSAVVLASLVGFGMTLWIQLTPSQTLSEAITLNKQAVLQPKPLRIEKMNNSLETLISKNLNAPFLGFNPIDKEQLIGLDETLFTPIIEALAEKDDKRHVINTLTAIVSDQWHPSITLTWLTEGARAWLVISHQDSHNKTIAVVNLQSTFDAMVEIPDASKSSDVMTFALGVFEETQARVLLLNQKNQNVSENLASVLSEKNNAYNLFHQRWLRHHSDSAFDVVQVRRQPYKGSHLENHQHLWIAANAKGVYRSHSSVLPDALSRYFNEKNITYDFVTGQLDAAGLQVKPNSQQAYLRLANHHRWMQIWLTPQFRYLQQHALDKQRLIQQLTALSIDAHQGSLSTFINKK
ncbi:MAG: poly-gamma-glutamate biosynthesis protein PgsC/CapC, partial [Cellvibrionales bacterium]|nr:poly-gamma-glutamate biosynthesis protein PgsC/CapC [Cellvibrionales bacterium]